MILIFWVKENSNNSPNDWREQVLDTTWISAPSEAKSSSTAPSQCHLPWMSGIVLKEVNQLVKVYLFFAETKTLSFARNTELHKFLSILTLTGNLPKRIKVFDNVEVA